MHTTIRQKDRQARFLQLLGPRRTTSAGMQIIALPMAGLERLPANAPLRLNQRFGPLFAEAETKSH